MKKDFVSINPDSGGSGETVVKVQVSQNTGGSRSTFITISGGGVTKTIPITQEAAPLNLIIVGNSSNIIKTIIT